MRGRTGGGVVYRRAPVMQEDQGQACGSIPPNDTPPTDRLPSLISTLGLTRGTAQRAAATRRGHTNPRP